MNLSDRWRQTSSSDTRVLDQDRSEHSSLIFKTFFHIFLIKQLIQIQNQLHKSNIIQRTRLQGFPCYGCERACLPDKGFALECLRFYERFIGFHSPLRGNPLNVFAIISLITISALGHSLDLTKIRNWKLLSQYKAINLCHLAVIAAQGNNVVSWPTWRRAVILFGMSAFIRTGFVTPRLPPRAPTSLSWLRWHPSDTGTLFQSLLIIII